MKNLTIEQICVSNFPYYKYSLEYALDSLERMGGKYLEMYACDPHFHVDDCTLADARALKLKIKNHGLTTMCFTPEQCNYPVNIAAKNPVARKRSIEVYKKSIQFAAELDCHLCQFLAGFGCLDEKDEDIWQRSVEALEYLADIAKAYAVDIALETSPKAYTCLTDTPKMKKMIEQVNRNNVFGIIDTAVLGYSNETIGQAIEGLDHGRLLRHVHVGDGKPNGHFILGEAELDLCGMMAELDRAGYAHCLSLEILNPLYAENPEYAMKTSFEWLKNCISR